MFIEQLNKALPNGAGGAEDADWNFIGHVSLKLDFSIKRESHHGDTEARRASGFSEISSEARDPYRHKAISFCSGFLNRVKEVDLFHHAVALKRNETRRGLP